VATFVEAHIRILACPAKGSAGWDHLQGRALNQAISIRIRWPSPLRVLLNHGRLGDIAADNQQEDPTARYEPRLMLNA